MMPNLSKLFNPSLILTSVAIFAAVLISGCDVQPSKSTAPVKPAEQESSKVPLQLWIVSPTTDNAMIERQWLSGSDQPIAIKSMTATEFLANKSCACDVVLFPSRMLGELLDRKWIVKLPKSLLPNKGDEDNEMASLPKSWIDQVTYDGEKWAVPLGTSTYVTMASSSVADSLAKSKDWNEALGQLQLSATKSSLADATSIQRDALVDRYLAIVGSITKRTTDYGVLFEMQRMRPRLTETDCLEAARVLVALQSQSTAVDTTTTSSTNAWSWLVEQQKPSIALVAPSMLNAGATHSDGCAAVRVPSTAIGWNTGSGLIASLSSNCRQSGRATVLLGWLQKEETRRNLAPMITGIQSSSAVGARNSSLAQAMQMMNELTTSKYSSELRLARGDEYRSALADALVEIISGKSEIKPAMEKAAQIWDSITESRGREIQRSDYERSLGLIR